MSLVSLSNVSYSLGARQLFTDLSFAINPGERTALVGLNGAGKSTLLRLISGEVEADSGVIARRKGVVIEYVPQILPAELREVSLFDALLQKVPDALRIAGFEYLIEQRLSSAGFEPERHCQTLGSLSGGELNRALVARALVNEPDLILLDEPTNHMDIDQVSSFENFLGEELNSAVVIVSHDREFLDCIASRTLFLRDQKIHAFNLPFSEARQALLAADDAARARREGEEREIDRLRQSARRLAEWGKVYSNEKFSYRAQSMEKRIERLEKQVTIVPRTSRAQVSLDTNASGSTSLVEIVGLTLTTPHGRSLARVDRLAVQRGERLAVVGRNGCGKSTLMRSLVGQWMSGAVSPQIRYNPALRIGYYDQELAHFVAGERIGEAVLNRCSTQGARVTAELVAAGFEYERHRTLVSALSGGERARLTFLILKLLQPHLLILDEPTNHLDVQGIEQLEEALVAGGSTVIFVSHDRRFLERVATRVVELEELSDSCCGAREHD